jgi:putative heme-binding domain-containing protein
MNRIEFQRLVLGALLTSLLLSVVTHPVHTAIAQEDSTPTNFSHEKLVAWCIVPFDGKKRGPAERASMLKRIGLRRVAYDWRQEHVATFEQEIIEYKKQGLEYFAFWGVHDKAFRLFEKYDVHPQIWLMLATPNAETQQEKIKQAAERMLPIVERTRRLGSKLGLYNHGGWAGEPANMVAVCQYLHEHHDAQHVGIVYNLHHAHPHIDDFADVLQQMKPYLLCLNLNGMTRDGDQHGKKILPLGEGEFDVTLLKTIRDSGYKGPIGIIGHTQDDVEQRLRDNLDGLDWIVPQLDGKPAGPKPTWRTWKTTQEKTSAIPAEYSLATTERLVAEARKSGNSHRGLVVFSSAKSACISCHKIGEQGGSVGPDLLKLAKDRKPHEVIASILWPKHEIKPEYAAQMVVTDDGNTHRGYIVSRDEQQIVLRDPTRPDAKDKLIAIDSIDFEQPIGTLMPDNLLATMSTEQARDLFRFLLDLGTSNGIPTDEMAMLLEHANAHSHGPPTFAYDRKPLHPKDWPSWQEFVNRDRIYDFYAKEADYFRTQSPVPPMLPEFPGLDGGELGHWGNQNEQTWASDRWNEIQIGSMQSGIFRGAGVMVPRGVCVQLGDDGKMAACFNPETLTYDAVWRDGFLEFSSVRHGFMHGVKMRGMAIKGLSREKPKKPFEYHGFYRVGKRVVFAYRVGEQELLDAPWVEDGRFTRTVAPADKHPLRPELQNSKPQWPQTIETAIHHGSGSPYAVDTIALPTDNPWNASLFCGGHGFLSDGSAIVCTTRGDVWRVSDFEYPSTKAVWRRFASGLNLALGVVVDDDGIFVLGRDQITRLHDLNGDGEADFYECFSNAFETSPAGHDFICGLERDAAGNFYAASGNQGIVRISPDGKQAEVVATGFRNPDGLGVSPDGLLTIPCSEGSWTPASMICATKLNTTPAPYFGYPGPKNEEVPALPLAYLPRALDNSSGGQTTVTSDRWGPLAGQLLHFSFGAGSHFLVLRDEVDGQLQGAVVPLPGEFRSGAHRGRFSPSDGQLYVTGMQGWGCYTPEEGCFQRVRYTGAEVQFPVGIRVHENGVAISFSSPLDREIASNASNHFAQCWNYRYSSAYGSPEFSTKHFGMRAHDFVRISASHLLDDGKTLFLELPDLQPVNQLHLRIQTNAGSHREMFATVHKLARPFTEFDGYQPAVKKIAAHPILRDLAMAARSIPNPHQKKLAKARVIKIETGSNLSYKTRSFRVSAGEPIALTLSNPDVVPHNWALIKQGSLQRVGAMANRLISDPEAAVRHYIPESDDILAYTDVVLPRDDFTIYFRAPKQPGRYPYLCTFPGHWLVMNGEMIVE